MRVIYEPIYKKIQNIIREADLDGWTIEKIFLTREEWYQFRQEIEDNFPTLYRLNDYAYDVSQRVRFHGVRVERELY